MENDSTENIVKDVIESNHSIDVKDDDKEVSKRKNQKHRSKQIVINILIFCIITSYTIWATVHFRHKAGSFTWEKLNETTTRGYGLLLILYLIYLYSSIYYILIKPYALPIINKSLWTPGKQILLKIRFGSLIFYFSVLVAALAYLVVDTAGERTRLIPLFGLLVFLFVGFLMSSQKRHVPWHTIAWGLILQFVFGFLTIRWEVGRNVLSTFSDHVNTFLDYGIKAAVFTYGDDLVNQQQVFAFRALSVIFFIGFVVNLLYYYGLMQKFVNMLGTALQYIMGTTICESVNSVAVAFVGMSEGPMMLRPYLKYLTDSEIHSMMLAGFASVSGSTFAAYIGFGARAQDLITASIMSAPSALCFSKLLYPEVEEVKIKKEDVHMVDVEYSSAMDAASKGASDAFYLIAAIISGVTATLGFVYFINGVLTWLGLLVGYEDPSWTLELITGKLFIPVAWIMGVDWSDCEKVGQLIGIKTMVNEFIAFEKMQTMILKPRNKIIATYAICGFSNPGSVGIMISTMATLVPEKKENVTRLVFRAFVGGALVCFMTACIAGTLMPTSALQDELTNSANSTYDGF